MTPLRSMTGLTVWIKLRRMFGLFCFSYACIHFSIWFWLDQNLNIQSMWNDVVKRPFITMGFLTLVLLTPLALTSNQWALRRLGRRWTVLHKLVYLIACTAILHYWWHKAGKNDLGTVSIYGAVIFLLLICRIPAVRNTLQDYRSNSLGWSNVCCPTMRLMNTFFSKLSPILLLLGISACSQTPPKPPGSTTYSPYTSGQIQEFNRQPLSPVEGPFGPVDPNAENLRISKERALDAKFYNQPQGEEEAEALETQSSDPYQPSKPVVTY